MQSPCQILTNTVQREEITGRVTFGVILVWILRDNYLNGHDRLSICDKSNE